MSDGSASVGVPAGVPLTAKVLRPLELAHLARELAAEDDVAAILGRVVQASVAQIDGAAHAGITVVSRRGVMTQFATGDLVETVDQRQHDTGEGPCLDAALADMQVVRVDDFKNEVRWPRFRAAVQDLPVASMLSFRLYTAADTLGTLNIYALDPQAFTEDSVQTGLLLAAHAAVAAAATVKSANLRVALESRDTIGQAKGILMERFKLSSDQAFDVLIFASQRSGQKLRDVAAELTLTGELPALPPSGRRRNQHPSA